MLTTPLKPKQRPLAALMAAVILLALAVLVRQTRPVDRQMTLREGT